MPNETARKGHALTLAAREAGPAGRASKPSSPTWRNAQATCSWSAGIEFQAGIAAEADILGNAEMREQVEVLEQGGDRAFRPAAVM